MSLPAILLLLCFNYLPIFGLLLAFKDYRYDKGFFGSDWVGFENFRFFFESNDAWIVTRNTLAYNLFFIATVLIGSLIMAIILNEISSKLKVKFYQSVMFFPYFLSYAVVSFIVYAFLNADYGILNRLSGLKVVWYSETGGWPLLLVLVNLWKSIGYNTIIIYASIIAIDNSYYEAAVVDGASHLTIIRKITIPLVKPIIIMLALIMLGRVFYANFGLFYMVPQDSGILYPVTDVIDTYVYRSLRVIGDIGMSTAVGLYQSLVGFLLVIAANRLTNKYSAESALF
jgi:putative aldouronate transport system permease protein